MKKICIVVACVLLVSTLVHAHELRRAVSQTDAVVIELTYADGTPFDFEQYEIYSPGGGAPFQVGRSDAHGRVVFVPDVAGEWRLKAFSEDGHGTDFTFETNAGGKAIGSDQPLVWRYSMIFVGVAIILGAFGLLSLFLKRRTG